MCLPPTPDPPQVLLLQELPRQVRELQAENPGKHEAESPGTQWEGGGDCDDPGGQPGQPGGEARLVAAAEHGLQ